MRRHLVRCCLALLATAIGGGCQSMSGGKISFRPPKGTFAKPEESSEGGEERPASKVQELAETANDSRSGTPAAGSRPASPQTKTRPPLDPATEILIENELKDATDDERAEWLARFETMTPRQISAALCDRDRRKMPEAPDPREEGAVDPHESNQDADSIQLASASRSAAAPRSNPVAASHDVQDSLDPWDIDDSSPD